VKSTSYVGSPVADGQCLGDPAIPRAKALEPLRDVDPAGSGFSRSGAAIFQQDLLPSMLPVESVEPLYGDALLHLGIPAGNILAVHPGRSPSTDFHSFDAVTRQDGGIRDINCASLEERFVSYDGVGHDLGHGFFSGLLVQMPEGHSGLFLDCRQHGHEALVPTGLALPPTNGFA
jgi:hypothetical protein